MALGRRNSEIIYDFSKRDAWANLRAIFSSLICGLLVVTPLRAESTAAASGGGGAGGIFGSVLSNWNWEQLPVRPVIQETFSYYDNLYGLGSGVSALPATARSRGDLSATTLVGGAARFYAGGQVVFMNGNFGVARYLQNTNANSTQFALSGGVNWTLTSACAGVVSASDSQQSSLFNQQVGGGINIVNSQSFSESAKCNVTGGFSLIQNLSVGKAVNSLALDQLNDNLTRSIGVGIRYDRDQRDNLQVLYTYGNTSYLNRPAGISAGLASTVRQKDVAVTYQYFLSPNFNSTVSGGLTRFELMTIGSTVGTLTTAPHYSLSVSWQPTPKIQINATASRAVGPPASLVGNSQTTTSAQFGASYQYSQKLTFNSGFGFGNATAAETLLPGAPLTSSANERFSSINAGLSYQVTPFISGSLGYQYSDRSQLGVNVAQNVFTAGLNYAPY